MYLEAMNTVYITFSFDLTSLLYNAKLGLSHKPGV